MLKGRVVLISVCLLLVSCSPIKLADLADQNPDKLITINKLSGDTAQLFQDSLTGFCGEINEKELYRVQIVGNDQTITQAYNIRGKLLCELDTSDPAFAQKSVAILVNGEPITLAQVQSVVNSLPQETRTENLGDVVNNMINQILLLQEAKRQGLTASDEEVDAAVSQFVSNNQISPTDMELESLNTAVRNQLTVQKILAVILEDIPTQVSEENVLKFYDDNKEKLILPETWNIRHIQINPSDRGQEADVQKARNIMAMLETSDFCDLVTQFSDDVSSIDKCGSYKFSSGQMAPSIEEALKEMKVNEVRLVTSGNAHHILHFAGNTPARQAAFSEVKETLVSLMVSQAQQQATSEFVNNLRTDANIVSYLG